jgi:hypothetical protein
VAGGQALIGSRGAEPDTGHHQGRRKAGSHPGARARGHEPGTDGAPGGRPTRRGAGGPGFGGQVGGRAEPAQDRGNLLIAGLGPQGLVQMRADLLPHLAGLGRRQAGECADLGDLRASSQAPGESSPSLKIVGCSSESAMQDELHCVHSAIEIRRFLTESWPRRSLAAPWL